jgi:hypothetical protein
MEDFSMYDFFASLDIHPSIKIEALAYIQNLLPEQARARLKYNSHDFGEYETIEVERGDIEPDEEYAEDANLTAWEIYDATTDAINEAIQLWRNEYADKVETLYGNN